MHPRVFLIGLQLLGAAVWPLNFLVCGPHAIHRVIDVSEQAKKSTAPMIKDLKYFELEIMVLPEAVKSFNDRLHSERCAIKQSIQPSQYDWLDPGIVSKASRVATYVAAFFIYFSDIYSPYEENHIHQAS